MESNLNENIDQNSHSSKKSIWHSGVGFAIFFLIIVLVMVAVSYLIKGMF